MSSVEEKKMTLGSRMKKGIKSSSKFIIDAILGLYLVLTLLMFAVSAVIFKGMERSYYADCSSGQTPAHIVSFNLNKETNVRITTNCPQVSFLSYSPPQTQ